MTRDEYLKELRQKLSRLPAAEQDDAISYYTEYFEDAGDDAGAMETLGSTSRLAAQITADYSARMLKEREQQRREPPAQEETVPQTDYAKSFEGLNAPDSNYTYTSYSEPGAAYAGTPPQRQSSLNWIAYVILGIFALPVALPVIIVVFALLFALIAVCIALVAAFVSVVIALIVSSIATLFTAGAVGLTGGSVLITIGGALVALGLGMLLIPLLIKLTIWLVRAIGKLASRIFNSLKRRTENNEEK